MNRLGCAVAALVLACGCGSSPRASDGSVAVPACAQASDCAANAACVCPGGARQCSDATCREVCQNNTDGSHTCASGGSCELDSIACCEGITNCPLICIRE
jgi:hypothetical protein